MGNKLNELNIGDEAVITGYAKAGEQYRQKLLSMGLTKGTKIKLLKLAPLGDPVEILVRGFKLSLRKNEAEILLLEGNENE
jgi:ferrous iron transport protein A